MTFRIVTSRLGKPLGASEEASGADGKLHEVRELAKQAGDPAFTVCSTERAFARVDCHSSFATLLREELYSE